jgi:ammonia channel protein AmtB
MARPKAMSKTTVIGIFLIGMTAVSMISRGLEWIDSTDFGAIFGVIGLVGSGLIGIYAQDTNKQDASAIDDLKKQIEELKNK